MFASEKDASAILRSGVCSFSSVRAASMRARTFFAAAPLVLAIVLCPLTAKSDEAPELAREPFRDCAECPLLVMVEPGSFMMGRQEDHRCWEKGDPVVEVPMAYPLAVGVYEVSEDEWEACRREGGCVHDPEEGRHELEGRPLTGVSWEDAQQYVRWLSAKTGEEYRLPSEAEWLYVSSVSMYGVNWYWLSAPVPRETLQHFSNRYGLHGLRSGVMEWLDEPRSFCFTGMPAETGRLNEDLRMLRGPSECWFPRSWGSSIRWYSYRDARGDCFGFRVVRPVRSLMQGPRIIPH